MKESGKVTLLGSVCKRIYVMGEAQMRKDASFKGPRIEPAER